jgi:type VI secretion system protein ImpF
VPRPSQSERLQPSLLDRLTDPDPTNAAPSRPQRVITVRALREIVIRDLLWLLNTVRFDAESRDLSAYPETAKSVVNYGITDLAGVTASSVDADALSRAVREAVMNFEPRLNRNSVQVRAILAEDRMANNTLVFEIEGELWADPAPLRFLVRTELDLETGSVAIVDSAS